MIHYQLPLYIVAICILIALLTIVKQRSHIIIILLSLEVLILNITIWAALISSLDNTHTLYVIAVILTMGAREAVLGLACLVKITRTFGNDKIKSSNINKC